MWNLRKTGRIAAIPAALLLAGACGLNAQLSTSAYRALGQRDLRHNSLNMVQGLELSSPSGVALDARSGRFHIYISDSGNHRVLGWEDARSYQNGDAPTLVLGQPDRLRTVSLGIGARGFNLPLGLAVHPVTGDLYVADLENNRVLRFPDPSANPARVEPDAVFGQPDFNRSSEATSRNTLKQPRGVAFDRAGNLWVADSGNHRVVRFSGGSLNSPTPPDADIVIGQADFTAGTANGGSTAASASGFDTPSALAFDTAGNLYVSDFGNARVLKFHGPFNPSSPGPTASGVWGQSNFTSRGVPPQASASTVAGPAGLAINAAGDLYVSVATHNRVLVFGTDSASGSAAKKVFGQTDLTSIQTNTGSFPKASPNSLSGPRDVKVDAGGNVFVADAGNHRILSFSPGSRSATRVWGQNDFAANGPNQVKPASINAATKMAIDYSRAPYALYVCDAGNHRVLLWKDSTRFRSGDPADLVLGQPDMSTAVANVDTGGSQRPSRTSLSAPRGLAVDPSDGALYVADSGNNRVLRFPRPVDQTGRITPDAVIGQTDFNSATSAAVSASSLRAPTAVALAPDGNVFIADSGNHRILEFPARPGTGTAAMRVYGQPGMLTSVPPSQASAQTLSSPQGLFVDSAHNLYVADTGSNRVLVFPNTQAAPLAGMSAAFVIGQNNFSGSAAGSLRTPTDVVLNSAANIFVADYGNNRVLAFPSLVFLPIAGASPIGLLGQREMTGSSPNFNGSSGTATAEGLYGAAGLYMDRQDTLYVGDNGNNRVLHFLKAVSVVNSATFQGGVPVSPGGLATLSGREMAAATDTVAAAPWPITLAEREVVIDDEVKAALQYVSATQVNLQLPWSSPLGSHRIAVRLSETGELVAGGSLAVTASSPGLFTSAQDGTGQAAALNQDGRVNSASNPAARGSIVTLYGTGQGQVSPPVSDGAPAPAGPLSNTVTVSTTDGRACVTSQPSMCVAIGSLFGEIQYSGLAPGFVGLWQINVRIPMETPVGNAPLRVLINGSPSNIVTVAVR